MSKKQFKPDDAVGYRHERIPPDHPECPYLDRWVLGVGVPGRKSIFSVRLHHFFRSDEDHLHDHPTWFVTIVLKGTYDDVVECRFCESDGYHDGYIFDKRLNNYVRCGFCDGTNQVVGDHMRPGSIRFRPPRHLHRVKTEGCWTLVLFGPRLRDWGFVVDGKWMRQRAYFRKYGGAAACREAEAPEGYPWEQHGDYSYGHDG